MNVTDKLLVSQHRHSPYVALVEEHGVGVKILEFFWGNRQFANIDILLLVRYEVG